MAKDRDDKVKVPWNKQEELDRSFHDLLDKLPGKPAEAGYVKDSKDFDNNETGLYGFP